MKLHPGMYAMALLAVVGTLASPLRAESTPVSSVQKTTNGETLAVNGGELRLQVFADRIIRVRFATTAPATQPTSLVVIAKPQAVKWEAIDTAESAGLRTASIEARVDRATSAITFVDLATGKAFLSETPGGRDITTTTVGKETIHGPAQSFVHPENEAIYGLGQHQDGVMNYVGTRVRLLQRNTDIGVPVLLSTAGYALLWDNAAVTDINVAKADKNTVTWKSEFGPMDYYVCYGPDLNEAIAGYRELTGAAPMFGRWAWGYWQSRERYESQEQILGVAAEYRKRGIPLDGVVQDWQYWGKQPWGSHAFSDQFPDPAKLVQTLHDEHVHAIISVWAKFDKGSKNHDELEQAGLLYPTVYKNVAPPGLAQWYDAFNPAGRAMYWRQINDEIAKYGWDGWWLDATEPELGGKWGEMREVKTAAGPGYSVFNAYPLETTRAVYEGQRARTNPAERPFILTRSAYAGQQRNGAVSWSGDIAGNWEVFKKQIPAGLNFVSSGIPYWNTDIGGFFGGDHSDEAYRELFTRWFEFGAFCPMFRVHGTGSHKEQWEFGPDTAKTLLKYDQLRYRLLPYIYSTSWQVTDAGASMMRPLAMDYRNEPSVYRVGDQFMFGPAMMVCPVTEPMGGTLAIVPPANLLDRDGHSGGLSATYYQGENFDKQIAQRIDSSIDFDWDKTKREGVGANSRKDPIPGLNMDHFSARWEGFIQTTGAGTYKLELQADDGMRMWVDGKLVIEDWNKRKAMTKRVSLDLPGDAKVPVKIEYFQDINAALINLRWQMPAEASPDHVFTRKVVMPSGHWRDFWTGDGVDGGKTIEAPAPIDTLPLFVRDGSIIPMGPVVQYAEEKLDAPLELRVYRGADGQFTLYDDAGDGFGYESGERAMIPITWDEKTSTLRIGGRSGKYPGMAEKRTFKTVFVGSGRGSGLDEAAKPDQVVEYSGEEVMVHAAVVK